MKLSWLDVQQSIDRLTKYLELRHASESLHKHTILGVVRGGLIPAVMLSHRLTDTFFDTIIVEDHNELKGRYIVVDDICDTGKTFRSLKRRLPNEDNIFCCLVYKQHSKFVPDFSGIVTNSKEWVVFPWEEDK
jgi:hypothetical protein